MIELLKNKCKKKQISFNGIFNDIIITKEKKKSLILVECQTFLALINILISLIALKIGNFGHACSVDGRLLSNRFKA